MVIAATPGPGGGARVVEATSALLTSLGGTVVGTANAAAIHEKIALDAHVITDEEFAQQLRDGLAAF